MDKKLEKRLFGTGFWAKNKWVAPLLIIVMIFIAFYIVTDTSNQLQQNQEQSQSLQAALGYFNEASKLATEGDTVYRSALSLSHSKQFSASIRYCTQARDKFSDAEQEYRKAKTIFENLDDYGDRKLHENHQNYYQASNAGIEVVSANYETCEYLENAWALYSLGEDGGSYIDLANQRIEDHDRWVNIYNTYLAKIQTT